MVKCYSPTFKEKLHSTPQYNNNNNKLVKNEIKIHFSI